MALPVSRMGVNQQDSNIIVKLIDHSLNSCESMVHSRVQVQSPGFVNTHKDMSIMDGCYFAHVLIEDGLLYSLRQYHIFMLFLLCVVPVAFSLQVIHLLYSIQGLF